MENGSNAFFSNEESVIARTVDLEDQEKKFGNHRWDQDLPLEEYYEIAETVAQITEHGLKRIALQFPDDMLGDSVPVFQALSRRLKSLNVLLFILADTSYGSCCIDEVAAQHVNADSVVHYGHACISPTTRLPAIYVFGKKKIDPTQLVKSFKAVAGDILSFTTLRLKADVSFQHALSSIKGQLEANFEGIVVGYDALPRYQEAKSELTLTSHEINDETGPPQPILFIGPESLALSNLLMANSRTNVFRYDVATNICTNESGRSNRLLMRRYALVQKVKDADVIGILVGTLGVSSYLHLISHLRGILNRAHKKVYTICVGKLNPAKLANFTEIECFVLVACPENSVVESKEFLRPIVTPFELEIALGVVPTWDGRYLLEFDRVLEEANSTEGKKDDEEENEPHFSLITGTYRQAKLYGTVEEDKLPQSGDLVLRNQDQSLSKLSNSYSSEFWQARTFKGLEQRIGHDEPSVLEQGRSGIARGYKDVDHE